MREGATLRVEVGDSVSKEVTFDAAAIHTWAASIGDTNPLHHDADYAASTRFGGLIASGGHVTALMVGMLGGFFAAKGLNVGVEITCRFQTPIRAGETMLLQWQIVQIGAKKESGSRRIDLQGNAMHLDGTTAVAASAIVKSFDAA
jgi:3-hydroxybutyryl-CoA dehydratase